MFYRIGLAIGFVIGFSIFVGSIALFQMSTRSTENVVVSSKERVTTGYGDNMSSKYLIFTDQGTFENTDSILNWKFNSSDIYGQIKEGSQCQLETVGMRVTILSWYKNIIRANCVSPAPTEVPTGS